MALTDAQVKAEQAGPKTRRLSDGRGLHLEINPAGGKYWIWRHRFPPTRDGKQQDYRIGPYPNVSLKQARQIRDEQCLLMRQEGLDPCANKKQKKQERVTHLQQLTSFSDVALDWHGVKTRGTWSTRHSSDVLQKLQKDILPALGDVPVNNISTQDCLAVLRAIEKRGSLEQGKRTLAVISQVFDYATALGHCPLNPARSLLRHAPVKTTDKRYPCIDWEELPELLGAIEQNPAGAEEMTLAGLRLLMLTFVRTNELIGAQWSEIDWDTKIWTIPAERMKGKKGSKKQHLVPLSEQSVKIFKSLEKITGPDGLIFKSVRSKSSHISNNTLNMALKRMGFDGRMCGHGFRALAMTNIQEKLKVPLIYVDRQLAHIDRNKVTKAYNYSTLYMDERIKMMQQWADLIDSITPR